MDMDDANVTRSGNPLVFDAFVKADSVINEGGYGRVMCSVSGGSDSDIVMDLVSRVDRDGKTRYVFFDTGLEYDATKRHISYLEERYGVGIERLRPRKPIPVCCREIGEPFISKHVSEQIHRLQSHGFRWEDEPFDTLYERYPRCRAALRWWSNDYDGVNGRESRFNIGLHRWLREFMVENPPDFRISNKCCDHAKKAVAADAIKRLDAELNITGIRKSEGGGTLNRLQGLLSATGRQGGRLPPDLLVRQAGEARLRDGVRHRPLGLLHEVRPGQDGLRRVPVRPLLPVGAGHDEALRARPP